MNVKISFTIPMEELPNKIYSILKENVNKLEDAAERLNHITVDRSTVVPAIKNIESIRKLLLQVDTQLGDCYSILLGYNKAIAEELYPPEEAQNAVDVDNDSSQG